MGYTKTNYKHVSAVNLFLLSELIRWDVLNPFGRFAKWFVLIQVPIKQNRNRYWWKCLANLKSVMFNCLALTQNHFNTFCSSVIILLDSIMSLPSQANKSLSKYVECICTLLLPANDMYTKNKHDKAANKHQILSPL